MENLNDLTTVQSKLKRSLSKSEYFFTGFKNIIRTLVFRSYSKIIEQHFHSHFSYKNLSKWKIFVGHHFFTITLVGDKKQE